MIRATSDETTRNRVRMAAWTQKKTGCCEVRRISSTTRLGAQLITATHPLDPVERRRGTETTAAVTIGDGAWLASGVIVFLGVSIGADAVIEAGSVVTNDMPARHLCYGNPCRVIREIRD
jgi:acetyltransferase-like isoleucine patch superfamily enzyme